MDLGPGCIPQQAIGGQAVQPQPLHPLVPAAPQHPDDHGRPQGIAQVVTDALDAGQDHPGLHRHVPLHCGGRAVAAVAALILVLLAEIVQNVSSQAAVRLAVAHHGVQPPPALLLHLLPLPVGQGLVVLPVLQQEPGSAHVPRGEEEDAVGIRAVPPGTARLLVVGL